MTENETYFAKFRHAISRRREIEELRKKENETREAKVAELFCESLLHFTDLQMAVLLDRAITEDSHSLHSPNLVAHTGSGTWLRALPSRCEDKMRQHISEKYGARLAYYGHDEETAKRHRGYYQSAYFGLKLDLAEDSVRVLVGQTQGERREIN